ncbi:MAG TPA: hypothetical protein VFM14_16535, partial [Gemmatimonadales bacterium]|nr:hypothetical protein [Gemmatimonadales bacterium]
ARYELLFLPDVMNDALQAEGKPARYYWLPRAVRIARRGEGGEGGQYKFHLLHFVGVQNADTTVGVQGTRETAGGVFSVTTTTAPPVAVLESAKKQLIQRLRGQQRRFWGLVNNLEPGFAPTPVTSSKLSITNLSPRPDGSVPVETPNPTGGGTPAPVGGGGAPAPAGGGGAPAPAGGPPGGSRTDLLLRPRSEIARSPRTIPYGRDVGGSALEPWYWDLQGQGPGPIDPAAEHAMSGLIGTLPTAILWQGFRGTYSPISVCHSFLIPLWSTNLRLKIRGNWDRVFQHFSANASARYYWFSGDIKAEFNNLRINGGITVELLIDGTAPGGDKLEQEVNKRIDLIVERFTELAKERIFDPAPPDVKPASSDAGLLGSNFGFGGGLSLKYRRDETKLELSYDETRTFRYNKLHVVSSSLEGFFDEIKRDPDAERKYFTTLYLDDWDRKVTRIVKPVANWSDASRRWVGDPVAFLSAQIGYPDTRGSVQWAARVFQSTDTADTSKWTPAFAKKNANDVANAPEGWTPDRTFIKRKVHFTEPPSALESPNDRVLVERNVIDLDPGDNGTLTNDNTIEVRADSVGVLEVGPLALGVALENNAQIVEAEFEVPGRTLDGAERPIIRFRWEYANQDEPRRLKIFTGDPEFLPAYRYRITVTVRGSIFTKGMSWTGEWIEGRGNGPLILNVPTPDDPGVTRRSLLEEEEAPGVAAPIGPPPTGVGAPPAAPPRAAGPPAARPAAAVGAPPGARAKAADRSVSGYAITEAPRADAGTARSAPAASAPVAAPPRTARKARKERGNGDMESESRDLVLTTDGWHVARPGES